MPKSCRLLLALAAAFAPIWLLAQAPADIAGSWSLTSDAQGGSASTLDLTLDGAKVSGRLTGASGNFPVAGEYKDGALTFALDYNGQVTVTFTGKLQTDGSLQGSMEYGQGPVAWQAVRAKQAGSSGEPFTSRVVASGLESPWEIVSGPDGKLWISERTARRIVRVDPASGEITPAVTIDDSYDPGRTWHEGLMGLALHPDLLKGSGTDYVYAAYTYDADPGEAMARRLKVRRFTYDASTQKLTRPMDILTNLPAGTDHAGGRLVIGPDRKLYLTRGDHGSNWLANACLPNSAQVLPTAAQVAARDWAAYGGKVLRIDLDGGIPADNPVLNGVRSHVFSYGHRNPQGLQFGPNGLLYESEHGPGTDDELNLITAGANYGWPHIAGYKDDRSYVYANWSGSVNPPCATLKFDEFTPPPSVPLQRESEWNGAFTPPLRTFFTAPAGHDQKTSGGTTIAAGGLEVYSSPAIPGWATSILQPGMTMGRVYRVPLSADGRTAVGEAEEIFRSANRYRDLATSPDGRSIYAVTDNDGFGQTIAPDGTRVAKFANPGSVLEFKYGR
jgi:PQQ-dependent dehydrogenase (s-GDH family)